MYYDEKDSYYYRKLKEQEYNEREAEFEFKRRLYIRRWHLRDNEILIEIGPDGLDCLMHLLAIEGFNSGVELSMEPQCMREVALLKVTVTGPEECVRQFVREKRVEFLLCNEVLREHYRNWHHVTNFSRCFED